MKNIFRITLQTFTILAIVAIMTQLLPATEPSSVQPIINHEVKELMVDPEAHPSQIKRAPVEPSQIEQAPKAPSHMRRAPKTQPLKPNAVKSLDLEVQSLRIGSKHIQINQPVEAFALIGMHGEGHQPRVKVIFKLDGQPLGQPQIIDLEPGSPRELMIEFVPKKAKEYTLMVVVNPDNQIQERSMSNNKKSIRITPGQEDSEEEKPKKVKTEKEIVADLEIVKFSIEPKKVIQGKPVKLVVVVRNNSKQKVKGGRVQFNIEGKDLGRGYVITLKPNQSKKITSDLPGQKPGAYALFAHVFPAPKTTDPNMRNNNAEFILKVIPAP